MLCRAGNPKSQWGLRDARPTPPPPLKAPDLPQPGEGAGGGGAAKGTVPGSDERGALERADLGEGCLSSLLSAEGGCGPTVVHPLPTACPEAASQCS